MVHLTRRGFMAATVAAMAPWPVPAQTPAAIPLRATTRTLDIDGRAATVWGLEGPTGQGLTLDPGQRFRVDLTNDLPEPTLIHWHGQIPPNVQDGVPDMPLPRLATGESRAYDFAPMPGTYWMHAHIPLQEMRLLAAPLIVRSQHDMTDNRQEVVMFLHDFSFKSPQEVMDEITGGHAVSAGHGGMNHGTMQMGGMTHAPMPNGTMPMDLNDYNWDAYLTNDRTLTDPQVVRVDRGGRIRLRIINASAATVFWIDTGDVEGTVAAVDGHAVAPLSGRRFGVAMGQRMDLLLDLSGEGAWPILALREGAVERTGLILATTGATVAKIAATGEHPAPAFDTDLAQEARLAAQDQLALRPTQASAMLMLGGSMQPYVWTINGATWGQHTPVTARSGQRVEIMFHNMSMMGHPMHLHGHTFQVVNLNGTPVSGARRDTVYVPPMSMVTVALDAGEAAHWMLHCHHMPHLETGMMTEFAVTA